MKTLVSVFNCFFFKKPGFQEAGSGDQLVGSKGIDPFPNLKLHSHIKAVTLYGVPVGHKQGWNPAEEEPERCPLLRNPPPDTHHLTVPGDGARLFFALAYPPDSRIGWP